MEKLFLKLQIVINICGLSEFCANYILNTECGLFILITLFFGKVQNPFLSYSKRVYTYVPFLYLKKFFGLEPVE